MMPHDSTHPTLDKQRIRADFNKAAEQYDQFAALQRDVASQLCGFAREVIPSGALVLDGGCGTGYVSDTAARLGRIWDLIQLDLSDVMCRTAAATDPFSTVVNADMESLPFGRDCFQGIISSLTFQWIEAMDEAFAEMYRVLKPGGAFMISTLGPDTLRELRDSFNRADASGEQRVNHFPTLERLRASTHKAGFEYLFSHQENRVLYYQDAYEVMRHTRAIGAGNKYKHRARNLSARSLFDRVAAHYRKVYGRDMGVPVTWEVFYLSARKPE